MKFSNIPAFSGLFASASASLYTQHIDVVCTGFNPSTVTQTVTVTAPQPHSTTYAPYSLPPYVTTDHGIVTSVDYHGSRSSIWVYPTGKPSRDCTVAIYENNVFVTVIVVNINVTVINGQTETITSTVTDAKATWAPKPPQTETYTSRNSTVTMSTSTKIPHLTSSSSHISSNSSDKPHSTTSSSTHKSSSSTSMPYSTGSVVIPSSGEYPTKAPGPVVPPKPTAAITYVRAKGRRAAQWYE
ncbi:hypothetical protein IFR04_006731 [Cadophora malorum]|uniref:Uncharacterized protein n=1 Tax=Cadophora malorum TaxID=108018 RepID=A0A8H7TJQ3_9HELO|nr:hypothetical protein IFR04_006731 [Cadophora malorum]